MKIYWMQPGEIDSISGGYIYNKNIIDGMRAQSVDVKLLNPGIDFPFPSKESLDNCMKFLLNIKSSSIVIVDSLILGTFPEIIEKFASKHILAGMIHLPLNLSPSFSEDEKIYFREREFSSFKHAALLFVTSEYTKSELIKSGINEEKIHVVTPGINTSVNQRNYPDKPKNLLCVSRITSSKGQLDLINALENLQHFNWNLTFCGGYDEQDAYYKEIRNRILISGLESRIDFTGEIPRLEVEKYYRQADLLILPSYFETYSMVLQEAMAFKLPVISANAGAVTQTANSKVAKFYKPGNIKQLELHLASLMDNSFEYTELVNGYSKLNVKFLNWSKKTEQFLNILEKYEGI